MLIRYVTAFFDFNALNIIKHIKEFLNEIGISTIENPIYNPQKIDYSRIKAEFDLEKGK